MKKAGSNNIQQNSSPMLYSLRYADYVPIE